MRHPCVLFFIALTTAAALAALANPSTIKRFEDLGFFVRTGTSAEMDTYVKAQIDKYAKLIRQIGLKQQ